MARPLSLNLRSHRKSASTASASTLLSPSVATPAIPDSASPAKAPPAATTTTPSSSNNNNSSSSSSSGTNKTDAAAAAAISRAEVQRKTRNDWVFPLPDHGHRHLRELRVDRDTRYVPRTEDPLTPSRSPSPPLNPRARHPEKDPYRFEHPDDVGATIEERRKRKRKEADEEIVTNSGLRIFEARRNAWTGAVRIKGRRCDWPDYLQMARKEVLELEVPAPYDATSASQPSPAGALSEQEDKGNNNKNNNSSSSSSNKHVASNISSNHPGDSSSSSTDNDNTPSRNASLDSAPAGTSTPSLHSLAPSPPSSSSSAPSTTLHTAPTSGESQFIPTVTLIPLPAPLLPPTHPTRALITPAAYPSIYSRVVVQGTSPRLPIPLSDIVSACVQGWKADGEWPPRPPPSGPEPLLGRRRRVSVRDGMKEGFGRGMRRVLRIVRGDDDDDGDAGKGNDEKGAANGTGRGKSKVDARDSGGAGGADLTDLVVDEGKDKGRERRERRSVVIRDGGPDPGLGG